ncbi:LysR family transcriptional regulator [Herbaspirillum sp. RTI4]|uniref:LysR family transcriptional regulator n=1 Tax=Herbaspirillum sp. RTI4 TaxID=3048640 RepID=UPI002AB4E702|nr:LysR family transcriptional regulator [Herbaspirillum sp. RTI4]MDY7578148.1 LysR family transcriptional regulator [Herbaspirillum sp. RTI4]MEA9980737.1 LysR family transcriptional regulator [Herbaspirillum sp. RTI4]
MQLSFKQIHYFLAAAETGQFSAAASKAHVTQTAITASIKELESALGVQLFIRHHASGVSLTVDGQKFLHHAHNIAAAVNSAIHDPGLMRQDVTGAFRIGATHSMLSYYAVPAIAQFAKAYPQIKLDVIELERPALEAALLSGEIDIGIAWLANFDAPEKFGMVPLTRSRRQLWLPAAHPLLNKRSIALSEVANLPYILYDMDETPKNTLLFWEKAGLQPNIRYRVTSIEAVRSLVAQGLGVSIVSDVCYRPFSLDGLRIEHRPLLDSMAFIEIGLAWDATQELSGAVEAFKLFMELTFGGPGSGVKVI